MADRNVSTPEYKQELLLTPESMDAYLQTKLEEGVTSAAIVKYRDAFANLRHWLADDLKLDAVRLLEWRKYLEAFGYSKNTIQGHVTKINNFLRYYKRDELCIPKPLRNDLTGRTFGYLTAIAPTEKRRHRYVVWQCVCKCGKEIEVSSGMLLEGHTTSCGCLNMEILQHHNRYEEGTELRQALEEKILNPKSASGYVGVQPKRDKWIAYITYKGKNYYLGTYTNIEDAVKARARAKEAVMEDAARIYEKTYDQYGDSPRRPSRPQKPMTLTPETKAIRARRSNNTSGYPGVTLDHGKWNASISVKGFRYRLGSYGALEDAVAVRKRAEELVKAGDMKVLKEICTNWQSPPKENKNFAAYIKEHEGQEPSDEKHETLL